ncbi:MAG: hypothetical protein M0R40_08925 [Firmicutes bacterium]|nr:hypothetical protein [Bacillota bacterium]
MKIYISKALIVLLMINSLLPFSAFADSGTVLYNFGEVVDLSSNLQSHDDGFYIAVSDLHLIMVSSDYSSPALHMVNINKDVLVYLESSVVILNKVTILYKNPLILINAEPYVSLDLVAMVFSSLYEIDLHQNTINIGIRADYTEIINGVIKLPNGKTAPSGGIKLEAFLGTLMASAPSRGGSGSFQPYFSVGFPGTAKPKIPKAAGDVNYSYISRKTVLIPEGCSSAEFVLEVPAEAFKRNTFVGYSVDSEEYSETYAVPYRGFYGDVLFFEINGTRKRSISGSISLPHAITKDTAYTVYACNIYNTYVCNGIIESGNAASDYLLNVKGGEKYNISVAFDDGEYKRAGYAEDVLVGDDYDIKGINFFAAQSNKISGTLILPEGLYPLGDISATITLQSAQKPYYYLDSKEITIPYGSDAADFELLDDMDTTDAIVYYRLLDSVEGLYEYGHFSSTGTSSRVEFADILTLGSAQIEFSMLKTKEITATVKLPNNEIADSNIYGRIYAVPNFNKFVNGNNILNLFSAATDSAQNYHSVFIEESLNSAATTFFVADEDGANYNVLVSEIYGSESYYHQVYYKENSSTVLKENASLINSQTDNIEITLMKQNTVSGNIETDVENARLGIFALYQDDISIRKDIYTSGFVCYSNDIDENYNFKIKVPSEIKACIFALHSSSKGFSYYAQDGTTNDINSANLINVNSDTENINFKYEGFEPLFPLCVTSITQNIYNSYWDVILENISDYDKGNIKMHVCLYDSDNRLQKSTTDNIDIINGNSYKKISIDLGRDYHRAITARLLLWTDCMQPLSYAHTFEN